MAAPKIPATGTIALTEAVVPAPRSALFPHRVHLLFSRGGQNDAPRCVTENAFTLYPNEKHLLLTDLDPIYHAVLDKDEIKIEPRSPLCLCYSIRVKVSGVAMTVGPDTPLTLLLRAGCLQVTHFVLTREQKDSMYSLMAAATGNNAESDLPPPPKKGRLVINLNR